MAGRKMAKREMEDGDDAHFTAAKGRGKKKAAAKRGKKSAKKAARAKGRE